MSERFERLGVFRFTAWFSEHQLSFEFPSCRVRYIKRLVNLREYVWVEVEMLEICAQTVGF